MNTIALRSLTSLTASVLLFTTVRAADTTTRFDSLPGGKIRIEGTSSIHDWQVEGKLIGGFLEVGAGFPIEPGQAATPGKVEAKADVFIPVRSLVSVEKDGKPYSTRMDDIMYEKLLQPTNPRIRYHLEELVLKEPAKAAGEPYLFDSRGSLVVAGVTNTISMPVWITPLDGKKVSIRGSATVKMTAFGIQPPAPTIGLGLIKTGDDVKLLFEWMAGPKGAGAAK